MAFTAQARIINAILIILVAAGLAASAISRAEEPRFAFNIPSQNLDAALVALSVQADVDVIGLSSRLKQHEAPAIEGPMTMAQALDMLLAGTELEYRSLGERSILIYPLESESEFAKDSESETRLEEIVISATRRPSRLQETPIAVTVLQQSGLDKHQVKDLRDIGSLVPGLEMINTSPQAAVLVQLRGVGTTNITEIADGPVAVHVDGVYAPRSQSIASLLHDVDRIEVLRGPQGTLFGRNSSSGSINVYTRQPVAGLYTGELKLSSGNYNQKLARAVVNMPVTEQLSVRFSGVKNKRAPYTQLLDNYAGLGRHYPLSESGLADFERALNLGQTGPESADQTSLRLSALWKPADSFSASVSIESYRDKGTGIAELDPTLVNQGIRAVVLDSPSFLNLQNNSLRGQLSYGFLHDSSLVYTFGLANMDRSQIFDADNGRSGAFEQQRTDSSRFRFYSHEVQFLNDEQARTKWVVGAFMSRERNDIVFSVDQQNAGAGRGPEGASSWISDDGGAAVSYAIQPDRRVESLGLFAQSTYEINDSSRLSLGARYTQDTKSDRGGRALNCRVSSVLGPYIENGSIGPDAPHADQIFVDARAQAAIDAGLPFDGGTDQGIGDQPCWVRQVNDFSETWHNTSGLIGYDLKPVEGMLLYGSISSGFKSGHIQDAGNSAAPETVVNYELGAKISLLNDRMRINAAAYRAEYDDLQFSNIDRLDIDGDGVADTSGSTVVRNASEATIQGLEMEVEWAITAADHLQLAATWMNAEFNRFEIPDSLFGNLFNPFASDDARTSLDPVDLSGNSPPRVPDWKLTLVYERDIPIASGKLTPRIVATFSDEYFLDIYNRDRLPAGVFEHLPNGGRRLGIQDSYKTLDFNLIFEHRSGDWQLDIHGKNLTDENIKLASGNFITEHGFTATYLPPRTYGLSFSYAMGPL